MAESFDCAQVERRLWEYLDRALPAEEAAAVEAHLERCSGCGPACRCCQAFLDLVARCAGSAGRAPSELRLRIAGRCYPSDSSDLADAGDP
jgi:anti-sigma factor (TIGR02949 family)